MDSLGRMLSIFDLLTEDTAEITPEQVAAHLDCSRTTSYRYLKALTEAGFLAGHSGGRYGLGVRIVQMDRQMRLTDPLLQRAEDLLMPLSRQIGENLLLNGHYGKSLVCIAQAWINQQQLTNYGRGQSVPLFRGAAGKVILAHLPAHQLKAIYKKYPQEIAAAGLGEFWPQFRDRLRAIRQRGYDVTHAEVDPGIAGVAAPIFDGDNGILGSLAIAIPVERLPEDLTVLVAPLKETVQKITDRGRA
ncbi:IclR family transcriptional regulator [Arthrobacter sp. I2-34]|uniref:IclR family transcriptional regulator n=1 Tax=Arthrobacter hankyongi TaxID=2904801 RepID=A0ABS9L9M3_9MICC|nr:IclR family transcriptional regulator [Arthrobacter hankyongi]MCG2623374.1 IclR family transcriptional regulator [Arthrobacter hankyongi]